MPLNVYVEGAQDSSADGVRKLAQAMSERYGLPAADLVSRLASGRFRVKANVDRATADAMVRSLEDIGARVVVEDTDAPAKAPAPRPQSSSLPPISRTTTGGNRPSMQSGLAAAFTTKERAQSEGDFRLLGGDSLSLASLDGDDAGTSTGAEHFAPAEPAPAPPPVAPRTKTAEAKPAAAPLDRFRPPDAEEAEQVMTLADDGGEKAERARKASLPPVQPTPATGSAAMRYSGKVESEPVLTLRDPMPNGRFAAGVFLCIILGFLPAHVIAGGHQRTEYAAIDAQVNATQAAAATDEESYRALDTFRATAIANKQAAKRSSILMALAIWALAGALLAYVYFKRVPWDTLGKKPA